MKAPKNRFIRRVSGFIEQLRQNETVRTAFFTADEMDAALPEQFCLYFAPEIGSQAAELWLAQHDNAEELLLLDVSVFRENLVNDFRSGMFDSLDLSIVLDALDQQYRSD